MSKTKMKIRFYCGEYVIGIKEDVGNRNVKVYLFETIPKLGKKTEYKIIKWCCAWKKRRKMFRNIFIPTNSVIENIKDCFCPFYICYNKCSIVRNCNYYYLKDCRIFKRIINSFRNRDFEYIRFAWYKVVNHSYWEDILKEFNIIWYIWQIKLGKYLQQKCREEKSCIYKALLPEVDINE